MLPLKSIGLLTAQYLRRVGVPQVIAIGTGYTHFCDCGGSQRLMYPEKVRFGFIPNNWFEFFYPKTGVTGPYMFALGLMNYLFSKEIYVCEHEFYSGLSLGIMCVVAVKKLGPHIAKYCDTEIDKIEQKWKKLHEEEIKSLQRIIADEELEQWRAEGGLLLMTAKRYIIALQLEAAYRKAVMDVYKQVIDRLDYQVACRNVEIRVTHKQMVTWLIKEVIANLPKEMDEESKEKCKADVSALAMLVKRV